MIAHGLPCPPNHPEPEMTPSELRNAILDHRGTFTCSRIHRPKETKVVAFRHQITDPVAVADLPDIGRLREFYGEFGSVLWYVDEVTGESAHHIAPVEAWAELDGEFRDWCAIVDPAEAEDYLPDWLEGCLVIGEEPRTGNYILMPTVGPEAGAVYHFEHDGFEFDRHAGDLIAYAEKLLDLDDRALAFIATHMRFIEDGSDAQWWIETLEDNRGNKARTQV